MKSPKVTIIILNWKGWNDTIECLESLYQITYPNYNVIVVDNFSEDDSIEKITEYCEGRLIVSSRLIKDFQSNKPIKILMNQREETPKSEEILEIEKLPSNRKLIIIKNEKNYGFSEGNNIAIRYALKNLTQDYILLLNNDTVVDKNFLTELIKVAKSNENICIVGPKIYYYDYNGKNNIIWSAGGDIFWWREIVYSHRGLNKEDVGQYDLIKNLDWTSGAALMIKTSFLKEHSLLNSKYFFGGEDVELCMTVRNKGLNIVFVPTSKVWHKVGISRSKIGFKTRDFGDYFFFIKQNFSLIVYIYHIMLFFVIILPKSAINYLLKYRDRETFINFLTNTGMIFKRRGKDYE